MIELRKSSQLFHGDVPRYSHPARRPSRWQLGRTELAFGEAAAVGASKRRAVIGGSDRPGRVARLRERRRTPAVAVQAVELQGVVAREQVGHGVQVDGGGLVAERALNARRSGVTLRGAAIHAQVTLPRRVGNLAYAHQHRCIPD